MLCSSTFQAVPTGFDINSDRLMESALPATDTQVDDILLESFLSDALSVTYTDSSCSNSPLSSDEDFYSTTSSSGRKRPARYPLGSPKRLRDDDNLRVIDTLVPPSPESGISMSSPKTVHSMQGNCNVWLEVLEQPEEHYRARYASEGSRGPLKGRSQNSYPKVKVMVDGLDQHVSAVISVSLVHHDGTTHGVCSLSGSDDDHLYNRVTYLTRRVNYPDMSTEFDQLRIKRERNLSGRGRQKQKTQKYDESQGYLLFQAEVATVNGNVTRTVMSQPIKLTAKVECAELHAIKNECGSVEGGDEVWIRGSKMIGNPTVLFEIPDQVTKVMRSYVGVVVKEECHQNLLVVKTPRIPFNEQVQSQVVVVTGKDKLRSNSLQFLFVPAPVRYYKNYTTPSPPPFVPKMATLSPSYSPQPRTPPSVRLEDMFGDMSHSPAANNFRLDLDICAQQLNCEAEKKILAGVDSLPMQGTSPPYNPSNKTTYP